MFIKVLILTICFVYALLGDCTKKLHDRQLQNGASRRSLLHPLKAKTLRLGTFSLSSIIPKMIPSKKYLQYNPEECHEFLHTIHTEECQHAQIFFYLIRMVHPLFN
ncbi:hypothetical protein EGW08_023505 [Elysia chlorotica]|uniref:Rubrerythrin diiron-binding domain-containing protein n=1 Tax=Elysia chlorotica TaxID=188477 RepID=A0A3S0Z7K7_ELYCH|nr:hypothetical protein EGW08_023505 [Elysia chlorotica]